MNRVPQHLIQIAQIERRCLEGLVAQHRLNTHANGIGHYHKEKETQCHPLLSTYAQSNLPTSDDDNGLPDTDADQYHKRPYNDEFRPCAGTKTPVRIGRKAKSLVIRPQ